MPLVSVTRLRIRSVRFLPGFLLDAFRSSFQLRGTAGFLGGSLLNDRERAFWTMTLWRSEADMRGYMAAGAHRHAMPKLLGWCDEGSVVHWQQDEAVLPDWTTADARMRAEGRPPKVRHPSPAHRTLAFRAPRTGTAVAIRPRG